MRKSKYTDKQLASVIKSSTSFKEIFNKLNLTEGGSNRRSLMNKAKRLKLDVSHIKIAAKKVDYKRDLDKILDNKIKVDSSHLKKLLLSMGLLINECVICNITTWRDEPAPLQMDHIDGNHNNNNLDNLRILCANCHAQTDTYGGKNNRLY